MKHIESVTSVCWVDHQHFISSGFDKVIYLWHINGAEVRSAARREEGSRRHSHCSQHVQESHVWLTRPSNAF